ncbi:SgcJ/EcaC family oxidoreductase [Rhodoblastus sp.]|uniref:SgcJ/EcaC family oxidoreductase n=1 Tax=Rhodoblastus sp. TaxID=1962975 RepID=UPI003F9A300F
MRRLLMLAILLCLPSLAFAGAKEEGQAVFDTFLADFSSANADDVASLFTPDALFWGTRATDLITTPEGIHQYFANAFKALPGAKASSVSPASVTVLSDDAVVVSGIWQVTGESGGKPVLLQLRNSLAVVRRGDHWLIASFHNSLRPSP